MKSSYIFED